MVTYSAALKFVNLQPSQNKKQSWIIQVTTHSIKNQGVPNFWMGLF